MDRENWQGDWGDIMECSKVVCVMHYSTIFMVLIVRLQSVCVRRLFLVQGFAVLQILKIKPFLKFRVELVLKIKIGMNVQLNITINLEVA